MPQPQQQIPSIPELTLREGSRWRHHRPNAEEVAAWFAQQPLDAGMDHEHFVGGVVIIPAGEKVKYSTDRGTQERFEQTFTPYVQVGTRIAYFHQLAEHREMISVIEAAKVPIIDDKQSAFYNGNMDPGYWWHIVRTEENAVRYLCCTMRVALYTTEEFYKEGGKPLREGRSTKQVMGGADINQLAKAQTSAIGRALGVAGILVIGTGVATAEDMLELAGQSGTLPTAADAELPSEPTSAAPAVDPEAELATLRARALEMQSTLQTETPLGWNSFAAWWTERAKEEKWAKLDDVPLDSLKGVVARMEREHQTALTAEPVDAPLDAGGESPSSEVNAQTEVQA